LLLIIVEYDLLKMLWETRPILNVINFRILYLQYV